MGVHPQRRADRRWLLGLGCVLVVGLIGFGWGAGRTAQAGELATVCPAGPPVCAFASVREAVAAVPGGATVVVEPGEYAGPVIVSKPLTLAGAGPGFSVITRGVIVVGPFPVTIRGFTITQGLNGLQLQPPPGLPAQLAPVVTLENAIIAGNAGNGIVLFGASRLILQNVTVTKNGVSVLGNPIGGGIALRGQAQLVARGGLVVRENGAYGIAAFDEASARISGAFVAQNGLIGVQIAGRAQATLADVISRKNGCYGVAVHDDAQAQIRGGRLERNGKAGLHVGGPSSVVPGCLTQTDTAAHAVATVEGTVITANPIGALVGDLSKEFDRGSLTLIAVTFLGNGCDLLVDPAYSADSVRVEATPYVACR